MESRSRIPVTVHKNAQLALQLQVLNCLYAEMMNVRSLVLSLLLLAVFTLSSIVFFEIFTEPPIIRREREFYAIAFTSDLFSDYDEHVYESNTPSYNPRQLQDSSTSNEMSTTRPSTNGTIGASVSGIVKQAKKSCN